MISYFVLSQACTYVHSLKHLYRQWLLPSGSLAGGFLQNDLICTPCPIPTALAVTRLLRTLRKLAEGLVWGRGKGMAPRHPQHIQVQN